MDYLPIFYRIRQRSCLVVGGGSVAARKVSLLRKAGADVTVVSPELCDELQQLALQKATRPGAREGYRLVIADKLDQARKNPGTKSALEAQKK